MAAWAIAGALVVTALMAPVMVHRARQWQRLATVPAEREAARVEVIRVQRTRAGFRVDYRPIRGVRLADSFGIDRWFDLDPPRPDEELDVWSLGPDGNGPLLMRQDNGTWRAASGSLH